MNPADVAGVRIRYRLGTLSAVYQLLLLNPQRGCSILSGLREQERSRRLTDTWAANTPCCRSLGELGWDGCADEEILLSSCGLSPPTPANPHSTSLAKPPPPAKKPKPPATPPPKPTQPKKPPTQKRKSFKLGSNSSLDQAVHRGHGKAVKGKQPQQQKKREEPTFLEGDESRDPLLGERVYVPYTDGLYPGFVTSVVGGAGGRVWVEHPREKDMFRV